jgi:poly(rC)-binding protein 2/3/4
MATMGHPGWNQPQPHYSGPPIGGGGGMVRSSSNGALDFPAPESHKLTLRQLLSGEEVQYLFGAQEQLIDQLRQQTGAGVMLSGEPGAHERVLTLTGPLEVLYKAFTLVCRKLWELVSSLAAAEDSQQLVVRLAVPAPQCGSIIGKGGSKIKEIRELSGATLNVAQESLPESTERSVDVIGTGEACLQAVYQICGILQEFPAKGEVRPYYPRALLVHEVPPPQSAAAAAAAKPIFLTASRAYTIEHGVAVLATPERLKAELEQILGTTLGPLGGGGEMPEYMNPIALLAVMAQPNKLNGGMGGPEISREMRIANEVAGSVIGRLGSKVAEIRQISGACVNVSTPDEVTPEGERIVFIRGTPESVMLAQFLVQSNIDLYKRDMSAKGGGGNSEYMASGSMGGGPGMGPPPPTPSLLPPGQHDFDFSDQMDAVGHRGFVFGRGGPGGGGGGGPPPPPYGRGGGRGMYGRGGRGSPMEHSRGGPIGGMRARGRRR